MAILPKNLNYTEKDFDSLLDRLNRLLASIEDFQSLDTEKRTLLRLLMEMVAWHGDRLLFYQDNHALEANLPTARLRQSILAHAARLGFIPPGRTAATVDVLIRLRDVPVNDVTFEAGTVITTLPTVDRVTYQTTEDVTVLAGADPPQATAAAENSTTVDEDFTASGQASQQVTLSATPYLDNSLVIAAENGVYEHANRDGLKTNNFFDSDATDRHFVVTTDERDRAVVVFGDGVNGEVPTGNIAAVYQVGGGAAGKVGSGTLTRIPGSFTDVLGNPVEVSVTNPERSSGGENAMSTAQIKVMAPRSVRLNSRTVAYGDFVDGAELVPGVARVLFLTADQHPGVPENTGYMYVLPKTGGLPSQALKNAVEQAVTVTRPSTVTFRLEMKDPQYATINVGARFYKKTGFTSAQVAANIRETLDDLFRIMNDDGETVNEAINFGSIGTNAEGLPVNEVSLMGVMLKELLADAVGVRKFDAADEGFTINGYHEDYALAVYEYPQLGTVTLIDGDTGLPA